MRLSENYTKIYLCHCEPFALCHSERSEESHGAQDRLRVAISLSSLGLLRSPRSQTRLGERPRNDERESRQSRLWRHVNFWTASNNEWVIWLG